MSDPRMNRSRGDFFIFRDLPYNQLFGGYRTNYATLTVASGAGDNVNVDHTIGI